MSKPKHIQTMTPFAQCGMHLQEMSIDLQLPPFWKSIPSGTFLLPKMADKQLGTL